MFDFYESGFDFRELGQKLKNQKKNLLASLKIKKKNKKIILSYF